MKLKNSFGAYLLPNWINCRNKSQTFLTEEFKTAIFANCHFLKNIYETSMFVKHKQG